MSAAIATMNALDDVRPQVVEGVHAFAQLDRAELLGRAFGGLAIEQRLDDPVDEDARQPAATSAPTMIAPTCRISLPGGSLKNSIGLL